MANTPRPKKERRLDWPLDHPDIILLERKKKDIPEEEKATILTIER